METKKPWAVDLRYFTPVARAVYLPRRQRRSQAAAIGCGASAHRTRESGRPRVAC
jgi:hypothetical protein